MWCSRVGRHLLRGNLRRKLQLACSLNPLSKTCVLPLGWSVVVRGTHRTLLPLGTRGYASSTRLDKMGRKAPISWTSLAVLLVAGGGVILYVQKLKREKEAAAEKERTRSLGKAALGGPFSLIDHNGERKTDRDFLGQWVLIYFGFTFCPDICPDELEKMAAVVESIANTPGLPKIQPLFITVDPDRDTPAVIKEYLTGESV